jgi:Uma2 family endonuclease
MSAGYLTTESRVSVPCVKLIETDCEPLETDWHRIQMNLLIEIITHLRRGCTDYFVGGNMFIYYHDSAIKRRRFRGPDFFLVEDSHLEPPRPYWAVWEEGGKFPDLIIELTSASTAEIDRTEKKDIYEKVFRTAEYFIFDPRTNQLEGWRLVQDHYGPVQPNKRGWLWSEQVGQWLGTWQGIFQAKKYTYLRFFDSRGKLSPTSTEAALKKVMVSERKIQAEKKRALTERQRAKAERRRAEAAEAELAHLRALLGKQGHKPPQS